MNPELISLEDFCVTYEVEVAFVRTMTENSLIEVVTMNETQYIPFVQLPRLERILRLYRDLDINLEGLDAIDQLLQRNEQLQNEIISLRNKLNFFERR